MFFFINFRDSAFAQDSVLAGVAWKKVGDWTFVDSKGSLVAVACTEHMVPNDLLYK